MSTFVSSPRIIKAAGTPPKEIQEFIGRLNTNTNEVSIARMVSPQGWSEPGQAPQFNEYSVVLKGTLRLRFKDRTIAVKEGQAIIVNAGEWVQYSTPDAGGAEYIAVCVPAFSIDSVHRDQ